MARAYVRENREDGGLTIFTVGMIAASISMMAIVIFACAKSSTKRKNKLYSDGTGGDDGNRTSAKTIVTGESNKAQKPRATSAPVRSTGEIVLVSAVETATTVVDIPSTNDVCNNNNDNDNDGGKDTRCHGGDSNKNNDVSNDRIDNYNTGASHDHTHHVSTNGTTSGGYGHHHDNTSGNTSGGGGWSSDHGGSSWSGGDYSGGGFSGGGDTGGFSSGGW